MLLFLLSFRILSHAPYMSTHNYNGAYSKTLRTYTPFFNKSEYHLDRVRDTSVYKDILNLASQLKKLNDISGYLR